MYQKLPPAAAGSDPPARGPEGAARRGGSSRRGGRGLDVGRLKNGA